MERILAGCTVLVVFFGAFAGCFGPGPTPTSSTSPPPSSGAAKNACTGYPAPTIEPQDALTGENAFDFMIGLVCDHSGPSPMERHRVPGTPEHKAASAYLVRALREHSTFTVRYDNFTGSQYEDIMEARTNSSYYGWFSDCTEQDRTRVRGLNFSNVEARGGTIGAPHIFLLMAHWDSKRYASDVKTAFVSANDGPSGVGVLLEMARVLSGDPLSLEVRILLTDGEDGFDDCHPLAGSTWYAEKQLTPLERSRIRSIVLLDMVGDPEATFYKGCGTDRALMDRIWSKAQQMGVSQFRQQGACNGTVDDHTPFEERGMKAVDIIDTGRPGFTPYWHTVEDTPDKVSPEVLGGVGRVVEAIVREPV